MPAIMTVEQLIASTIDALSRCPAGHAWHVRHHATIDYIEREHLPRGSGFDCGTKIDRDRSRADRLVLTTEFHHMNDVGMYDGWTEHTVAVKPSFLGLHDIHISGRDRNQIKDYIADIFDTCLRETVDMDRIREVTMSESATA